MTFHWLWQCSSCLRSWLEGHHNCPTCRYALIDTNAGPAGYQHPPQAPQQQQQAPQNNQNNQINQINQNNQINHHINRAATPQQQNVQNNQTFQNQMPAYERQQTNQLVFGQNHPTELRQRPVNPVNRELFRFNGNQWFSWLPNIQIVSERRSPIPSSPSVAIASVPPEMVRYVREIFPNVPENVIALDLVQTRNVQLTIDNLIEGRIVIPEVVLLI